MSNPTIWTFIKFFKEEDHANAFIDGDIYMNRLSYFRQIEEGDGRSDRHEAAFYWYQPTDIEVTISGPGLVGELKLTKADLAAPVHGSYLGHDYLNLFCLYAVHSGRFVDETDLFSRPGYCYEIDDRCLEFGKWAVIVPAAEFIKKFEHLIKMKNIPTIWGLINYYDKNTFSGQFDEFSAPFNKHNDFSYQQEFRICVNYGDTNDGPITLNIGDLGGIAKKLPSKDIIRAIKLNWKPKT